MYIYVHQPVRAFYNGLSCFRVFAIKKKEPAMGYEFEVLSGTIIEAAIDGHRQLGPGFLESIYENAMRVALGTRGIFLESQKEVSVGYEGHVVGVQRLDLIVGGEIVVEIKAIKALEDIHFAQLRSYLKATRLNVGLLLNFNAPTLVIKRIVLGSPVGNEHPASRT